MSGLSPERLQKAQERMEQAQDGSFPRDLAGWATEAAGLAASVEDLLTEVGRLREKLEAAEQEASNALVDRFVMEERLRRMEDALRAHRMALDAAMQYVAPKDRDWIERLAGGER